MEVSWVNIWWLINNITCLGSFLWTMPKNCTHERDNCSKFLYLIAKQYKWTWFAYYVEEKQHIIKVWSSENKHTNKTAPTCDPAEMWQQHRLLCHELHDSSVVSLPTVYYRSKSETYSAIESLDLRRLFSNIFWFLVYILPRMEVQTSPKAGTAKQNANSKPYADFGILH